MQHSLMAISAGRFLDLHTLSAFAGTAGAKYIGDDGRVSSWDVDAFVKAYREHIGPEQDAKDRKRLSGEAVGTIHSRKEA